MSRCTDTNLGRLLHAYELRQLDEAEAMRFEEHLLTCTRCFNEIARFGEASDLLVADPDVRRLARDAARSASPARWMQKLKSALWPSGTPALLRPAITMVALALLIYPAYRGLTGGSQPEVQATRTLVLSGTRGESPAVASGAPLSLVFRVSGANPGDTLRLVLSSQSGRTVFEDRMFTDISDSRLGTISFAARSLARGRYHLSVSNLTDSLLSEYTFQIE